ncbi:hypothetical protein EXU29_08325 [Acinetobacter wuhouensis]|uniref:hypothetical protein n=1 Tax=Acinetobacter wuhouensis TaxID=1879050 RepID=UPI0010235277|nr:hypothetical protein [Acinetobacter wuhouensis]RZG73327.1 hypothetical protein EXU29_08325 [Acinetobacter wuhouensis]
MIKQQILNFLNELENDKIDSFFRFLIQIKYQQHLSKQQLYQVLMEILQDDVHEQSCAYNILTDTLDYFVGYHSPLVPTHFAYAFVKALDE